MKHNGGPRRSGAALIFSKTHGQTNSKAYRTWGSMKARCLYKGASGYDRYGGRGIKVCPQWMTFEGFLTDMGHPPTEEHSLDRIDSNGNYEPGNCRWVPMSEQVKNTRRTVWVTINGHKMCLKDAARLLGICRFKLRRALAALPADERGSE